MTYQQVEPGDDHPAQEIAMSSAVPDAPLWIVPADGRLRVPLVAALAARHVQGERMPIVDYADLAAAPVLRPFVWVAIEHVPDHADRATTYLTWLTRPPEALRAELTRRLPQARTSALDVPTPLQTAVRRAEVVNLPCLALSVCYRDPAGRDVALNELAGALVAALAAFTASVGAASRPGLPSLVAPARAFAGRPRPGDPDLLNYRRYAVALAALIRSPSSERPLTIAIDAPWGLGKSALLDQIRQILIRQADIDHGLISPNREDATEPPDSFSHYLRRLFEERILAAIRALLLFLAPLGVLVSLLLWWGGTAQQGRWPQPSTLVIVLFTAGFFWLTAYGIHTPTMLNLVRRVPLQPHRKTLRRVFIFFALAAIIFFAYITARSIPTLGETIVTPVASAVATYAPPTATPCPTPSVARTATAPPAVSTIMTTTLAASTPTAPTASSASSLCWRGPDFSYPVALSGQLWPLAATLFAALCLIYLFILLSRLGRRAPSALSALVVASFSAGAVVAFVTVLVLLIAAGVEYFSLLPTGFTPQTVFLFFEALLLGILFRFARPAWRRPPLAIVTFNAWLHAQEEALTSALTLELIASLRTSHSPIQRLNLELRLRRESLDPGYLPALAIRALTFLLPIGIITVIVYSLLANISSDPGAEKTARVVAIATGLLGVCLTIGRDFSGLLFRPVGRLLAPHLRQQDYRDHLGNRVRFRQDFARLVRLARNQGGQYGDNTPLVIMIEDLDRCAPTRSAEIIEALVPLLETDGCVFVLALDSQAVATSISIRYKDIDAFGQSRPDAPLTPIGQRFLERVIDVHFRLPLLQQTQLEDYTDRLLGTLAVSLGRQSVAVTAPFAPTSPAPARRSPRETGPQLLFRERSVADIQALLRAARHGEETYREAAARLMAQGDLQDDAQVGQALAELEIEEFDRRKDIRLAIKSVLPYLDKTPRQLKRFINLYRLQAILAASESDADVPAAAHAQFLAAATLIALCWPNSTDIPPPEVRSWLATLLGTDERNDSFVAMLGQMGIPHKRIQPPANSGKH